MLNGKIITQALKLAFNKVKTNHTGKNADYIPYLKNADPNIFGITIVTTKGEIYEIGDTTTKIAIESIAKVFTLCLALEENGKDAIIRRELFNYECFYSGDIMDCVENLTEYGYCFDDVHQVYRYICQTENVC